jgi:hypothetical protein
MRYFWLLGLRHLRLLRLRLHWLRLLRLSLHRLRLLFLRLHRLRLRRLSRSGLLSFRSRYRPDGLA